MMQASIEPLAAANSIAAPWSATTLQSGSVENAAVAAAPRGFAQHLLGQLGEVDVDLRAAEAAMHELAAGRPVQMHEVMISLERAQLSVQTFLQIRNKLVESYQDLMRMQL